MANDSRDDFSQKTIEILRGRVANRCSNPECRIPTTGPKDVPDKMDNIGIAAHICAAAPGGPRYDKTMTHEERKSIENGIWLCNNCSREIDNNPDRYPVNMLKAWKVETERLAQQELGQRLPDQNYAIDTLTTALTGYSKEFIADVIENACKASENVLETIDPRFGVETSYRDATTRFTIFAKEAVETKLTVNSEFAQEFAEKFERLIEHGEPLEIDGKAIKMSGSKLIELIFSPQQAGIFKILPNFRKTAIQKMWIKNPHSEEIDFFDDTCGAITIAEKSFTFNGTACDGLLVATYRLGILDLDVKEFQISIKVNFEKWHGIAINVLPYFEKLYQFFKHLVEGWELSTKLEAEGKEVFLGGSINLKDQDAIKRYFAWLRYIFLSRKVCKYLDEQVNFDTAQFKFSEDDYNKLLGAYNIISGDNIQECAGNVTCPLVADKELKNINIITEKEEATSFRFDQIEEESVNIFGRNIALPRVARYLTKVKPKVIEDISKVKPGDVVLIELIPEEGNQYMEFFIQP